MQLTLLFDHRFYLREDGSLSSLKNYSYSFFAKRYLPVFDRVSVLARVSGNGALPAGREYILGDGVKVVSLGDWHGAVDFAGKRRSVRAQVDQHLRRAAAVLMIAPGAVGTLAFGSLRKTGHPYGVEVVTDPYDVFASGAVKHPLRPFFRWWLPWQLRRQCAQSCATAYVTKEALQRRYPSAGFSIGASDVEITAAALVDTPRTVFGDGGSLALVYVGTLAQLYKAPDVLVDAVGQCIREGLSLRLVLIGDGKHRQELEARAEALGLSDHIRFLGQLSAGEAVRDQLDRADLFVLPSYQEGLPRAMVEAMARGLPCIGSTVGGIPELLAAEDMVAAGDPDALARKIREVVADPARMARMSTRNLEKAKEYREDLLDGQRLVFYRYVRERTEQWLATR